MAPVTSSCASDVATTRQQQQQDVYCSHDIANFESHLLRQLVHPFFARMNVPKLELSAARSRGRYTRNHSGITGLVLAIADEIANQFQNHGRAIVVSKTCCAEGLMAAISLAMHIAGLEDPPQIRSLRMQRWQDDDGLESVWRHWQCQAGKDFPLVKLEPRAANWPLSSYYDWARSDNSPQSRLERLVCACSTLNYLMKFRLADDTVTRVVHCDEQISQFQSSGSRLILQYSSNTVLGEALLQIESGQRVAIVNAGSAYHVGGGFLTGGRHSLEEAICVQSTLYSSLRAAQRDARKKNTVGLHGLPIHIPIHGAVLSTDVTVFRAGTEEGYAPLSHHVRLDAVLTVAMPNMNPDVKDSPLVSRHALPRQFYEKKWEAVIKGALKVGVHVLVIPDAGCGVFRNNPILVGSALAIVLRRFRHQSRLPNMILTGRYEFYDAVCRYLSEEQPMEQPKPRENCLFLDSFDVCTTQ